MNSTLTKIYNRLPAALKEVAATYYAKRLQSFRRNETSAGYIQEAAEREQWSRQQWVNFQQQELETVLQRAVTHVPYYRSYWQQRGMEDGAWKHLENWPVLTKETLRTHNELFLADDCNPRNMYTEQTSGTSGTPVKVWWSKETTLKYYALYERRIRNWHGVTWDDPYLMLGGRLVVPVKQQKPPFWVNNSAMNQLYLSSYHLSKSNIEAYISAIQKFKPTYMFGYASSMYSLALLAEQQQLKVPTLACAVSNAEPLLQHQRECIERVFNTHMVNTYGMSELVAAACSFGNEDLVLWPEVGYVEVLADDNDKPLPDGETGRLICTNLLNKDMPLIRYEIGDRGCLAYCNNGIHFKKITELSGRMDDMVITKDGRRIGRLDPVFKSDFNIVEAQIIQKTIEDIEVHIVPADGFSNRDAMLITDSLRSRVGDCNIKIVTVESIPRTNSGKFKAVISHVKSSS
jgi:phenylacetate-CoA ligase